MRRIARPTDRPVATDFAAALALAAAGLATPALGAVDVWRWIPAETRVVLQYDPRATNQARAREAFGIDALAGRFATPSRLSKLEQVTVAYVPVSGSPQPVAFARATAAVTNDFKRMHGPEVGSESGRRMYGVRSSSGTASQLEPECVAEGPRPALATVLQMAASATRTVGGTAGESARRLLQRPAAESAPVSLVYVAPPGGADLYTVLGDLDAAFGAEMCAALAQYEKPIQMLGVTHAVRVDLRQEGSVLATTVWLAMPNRMAAQIASVSLDASRDMIRVAARNAVKGGSLSAADASVIEAALATLETHADGDLVRASLRIPGEPSP